MSTLDITYTVPVSVQIDTKTGRVLRVVVIDEGIVPAPQCGVMDVDDTSRRIYQPERSAAYELADGADWPAWRIGF